MRRLVSLSLWSTIVLAAAPALVQAQPETRDHRPPAPPAPNADRRWPTEAPPPSREERVEAGKAGQVWVKGRWDWKDGKWDWMAGHWEREQNGKHWREARWENRNGHYELNEGGWDEGGAPQGTPPGPANGQWPTEAPPPNREEKIEAAKEGQVWVKGRWDWKNGKWDWMSGHWERQQNNKRWREARWENRNGHYELNEGGWDDANGAAPQPPDGDRDRDRDHDQGNGGHRREWKLDRPVVSSYWPTKGKAGARVMVRGHNFPTDATVVWGDQEIKGAKVTPDEIEFRVPDGATSGEIRLRTGHGRGLAIGTFEVAASYDAVAEQKRMDDERHRAAEAAWSAQQARFAKDRAARQTEVERRWHDMEGSREDRRRQRLAELKAKWDRAFLSDPDTQAELTLHAQRVAELSRMHDVAEINGDGKLGVRIENATARENARHEMRMTQLHDSFGHNGGPQ